VSTRQSPVKPFVEIANNASGYGLMCYDDMDVTVAEVICRSLGEPKFLDTYKKDTHFTYTGQ